MADGSPSLMRGVPSTIGDSEVGGTLMNVQHIGRLSLAWVLTFLPAIAWAQALGGIAGVVKDATGAVLAGVTVEAASPALIEKLRTVVTDGQGQYKIVELPLGI